MYEEAMNIFQPHDKLKESNLEAREAVRALITEGKKAASREAFIYRVANGWYLCTFHLARRVWPELPNHRLHTLAAHIGLEFRHHHAQADVEAAGRVLVAMMKQIGEAILVELLQMANMEPRRFAVK